MSKKRMRPLISAGCTTMVVLNGCWSFKTLPQDFTPHGPVPVTRKADAILISIGPDERPLKGASSLGGALLVLLPLVPYGHHQISPDLGYAQVRTRPGDFRDVMAETLVKDLQAADIARVVGIKDRAELDKSFPRRYELKLVLKEGVLDRYATLYGLSFAGAFVVLMGLPAAYGSAQLAFEAEILDASGRSLGKQEFAAKVSGTDGLWTGPGIMRKFPAAYQEISPAFRQFVAGTISSAGPQ